VEAAAKPTGNQIPVRRMWKANKGPGEGSGVPGGAKNQARGIYMIDKGTDRIPRRWSTLKAVTWKDFLRESVVDPSKALAAKAVNARVLYNIRSGERY